MLNHRAMSLMESYARSVWAWQRGDDEPMERHNEISDALEAEFGIFAQVRGISHGEVKDMVAVFYAGRNAWRDNKGAFMSIPFSQFENR